MTILNDLESAQLFAAVLPFSRDWMSRAQRMAIAREGFRDLAISCKLPAGMADPAASVIVTAVSLEREKIDARRPIPLKKALCAKTQWGVIPTYYYPFRASVRQPPLPIFPPKQNSVSGRVVPAISCSSPLANC